MVPGKRAPIPTFVRRDSAQANGKPAGQSVEPPPAQDAGTKAAATASPTLASQTSADKRVSVFAGRLSGNFADQVGIALAMEACAPAAACFLQKVVGHLSTLLFKNHSVLHSDWPAGPPPNCTLWSAPAKCM